MAEGMDRTNRTERTDLLWAGEELKKAPRPAGWRGGERGEKTKLSAVVSGSELGLTGPAACRTDEVKPET